MPGYAVDTTWATFLDSNPDEPGSSYTATIDWGDGSSDALVVGPQDNSVTPATFVVFAHHQYASAGTFSITLTVSEEQNRFVGAPLTIEVDAAQYESHEANRFHGSDRTVHVPQLLDDIGVVGALDCIDCLVGLLDHVRR